MTTYLDTVIVVYLVERVEPYFTRLVQMPAFREADVVTSDIARMECLVGPIQREDRVLRADYERFFSVPTLSWVPLSRAVMEQAAEIRAEHRFHTPDAIHLAAAVVGRCEVFLTNDNRLARYTGLRVETVSP